MEIIIERNPEVASVAAAKWIVGQLAKQPALVLGLATGRTPLLLYRELIRLHREEGVDFSRTTTFNLDEYLGLPPDHPASYHRFMRENLFSGLNIPPERNHIPDGLAANVSAACAQYEQAIAAAGGIDIQILGLGSNGHLGFNEPTSSLASRTRDKRLDERTIGDNREFFRPGEPMPRNVITMGIANILEARRCLLLAYGERKADAVAAMVEGPVTSMVPASALQFHPAVKVFLDEAAAAKLKLASYYRSVQAGS
jgi:glucosamine-6-phosphate deaminase